jgi:hypothetical protein
MIEYLEDVIEERPFEEFPSDVRESNMLAFKTGDTVFDKWQMQDARGEKIDFEEAFISADAKKAFEAIKEESKRVFAERFGQKVEEPEMPEDIHDDYTSVP